MAKCVGRGAFRETQGWNGEEGQRTPRPDGKSLGNSAMAGLLLTGGLPAFGEKDGSLESLTASLPLGWFRFVF